jgi:serine kinase of HPr protein (carbohydrate metabolism regulator)
VIEDPLEEENTVYYDPQSKTAFLINIDYYGWIKSLALSLAGDVLEDEHDIYSVHGACLDVRGKGVCMLGASGAGKTTHTYGLLRSPEVRVVSDDWFYARIYGDNILAYGSEKNFYIRADLSTIWKEFEGLVKGAEFDNEGRAVVDLRQLIGKGRILPLTTLDTLIILKRDPEDKETLKRLEAVDALKILEDNDYFNPHLLVRNEIKRNLRSGFFEALLSRTKVYQINTIGTPVDSQKIIKEIAGLDY